MIGKQYKKGQEQEKKGARTVLERGRNGFWTAQKRNLARFGHLERAKTAPRPLSRSFLPFFTVPPLFHPFFTILTKNGKRVSKFRGTGKERKAFFPVSFPFLSFLLFFSRHTTRFQYLSLSIKYSKSTILYTIPRYSPNAGLYAGLCLYSFFPRWHRVMKTQQPPNTSK